MTMAWLLVLGLVAALQQPSTGQAKEPKRLELRIRPPLAHAPGAIRATAVVERRAENVALTLSAECPDYLRRSTIQLDGAYAARKHIILFEPLPACKYEIAATLHLRDGSTIVEVMPATVVR